MRRLFVLVAAAAALAAGAVLWARAHHVPPLLALLRGDDLPDLFRHMGERFPSRPVRRGQGAGFAFGRAERPLDVRFEYGGQEETLDAFLGESSTTGLLVVQDDAIVVERYLRGADEHSLLTSFSVAKSFVSALIGAALAEGKLASIDVPVSDVVPSLRGTAYDGVPVRHVLQMSSGVRFDEDYADPFSDVDQMFVRSFVFGTPVDDTPKRLVRAGPSGQRFDYISVDTLVLGAVLRAATGKSLAAYLEEKIWRPLAMESDATWVVDRPGAEGVEYAFCCLNATLRDYARFGRLFLRGGDWDGTRVLPETWVRESVVPGAPYLRKSGGYTPDWDIGYQYQWWVPNGPDGEFAAIGVYGQYIYVNPVHRVVIVKTSADPGYETRDMETLAAFRAIVRALGPGEARAAR
ncbi:MAG TPA: serine hydrolase [Myxococcota bacterium]|jgi:CubicO group peptidase (beta-lactamase class C family)|nr:serine hydrolase [Myxococcota bacterium]